MKGRFALAIAVAGVTGAVSLAAGGPQQLVPDGADRPGTQARLAGFNPGTALDDLGRWADEARTFKRQLDAIRRSDDPAGEALAQATCQSLTELSKQDTEYGDSVRPYVQPWSDYLREQAEYVPGVYGRTITTRINQFDNTLGLATINPRAAQIYVHVCVLDRR